MNTRDGQPAANSATSLRDQEFFRRDKSQMFLAGALLLATML
jgi:hypothetical protein